MCILINVDDFLICVSTEFCICLITIVDVTKCAIKGVHNYYTIGILSGATKTQHQAISYCGH